MVSLVVRRGPWLRLAAEKFTRKEKRARGREKSPNKEEWNNEYHRALAGQIRLLGLPQSQVVFGAVFFRGSFLPGRPACPPRLPVKF